MEKENLEKVIHLTNISSVIIVTIAILGIIISGFMLAFPKVEKINNLKLDYVMKLDSILFEINDTTSVYAKIDINQINRINKNNKLLFKKVDTLVSGYEERHNDILLSNKKQNDFVSFAAVIFAFIVSIAGFFGFKSINEMKKSAIESAEEVAKVEMREKYSDISDDILKTVLATVNLRIDKKEFYDIDSLQSEIDVLKIRIDNCCQNKEVVDNTVVESEKDKTEIEGESMAEEQENEDDLFSDEDLEQ